MSTAHHPATAAARTLFSKTSFTKTSTGPCGRRWQGRQRETSRLLTLVFVANFNDDSARLMQPSNSWSYCSATKSATKSARSPIGT